MPATLERETNGLYVFRFSGVVKRSEFGRGQHVLKQEIDSGKQPRILAIAENFEGWESGADWNDLDFQLTHGNEIERIAIVADPKWEVEALAFAGAGFRRAPVKFFPTGQLAAARVWLADAQRS
jgi:hypothetical protein